jgi:hypothetical protein
MKTTCIKLELKMPLDINLKKIIKVYKLYKQWYQYIWAHLTTEKMFTEKETFQPIHFWWKIHQLYFKTVNAFNYI